MHSELSNYLKWAFITFEIWKKKKKIKAWLKRESFAGWDLSNTVQENDSAWRVRLSLFLQAWLALPSLNLVLQILYSKDQPLLETKKGMDWGVKQIPQTPKYLPCPPALVPDVARWTNSKELGKICIVTDSASVLPGRDHCYFPTRGAIIYGTIPRWILIP